MTRLPLLLVAAIPLMGCASPKLETKAADKPLMGCASRNPETKAADKPPKQFQEANFGVRFSHSDAISVHYNPHGGAAQVMMSWRGKPIGGLKICPRPPAVSVADFIEAGKDYYKKKYNASRVEYRVVENPQGYTFHHISVKAKLYGANFVIERFVYLSDPPAGSLEEYPMETLFGLFSFEFLMIEDDQEELAPEIRTVIDTFRIAADP